MARARAETEATNLHPRVPAFGTRSLVTEPVKTLAVALLAEVVREWVRADEANERVELADAVLKRSPCAKVRC